MIIYCIINKINGKKYVGQTTQKINVRFSRHCRKGNALYNAIKKYGKENFNVKEIDRATNQNELNEKEIFWIKKLDTLYPNGYNLTTGGEHPILTEITKLKLRIANLGKRPSLETLKKMSASQKIAQLRPEVVKQKRKRMLGNKFGIGFTAWNKGIKGKESHAFGNKYAKGNKTWVGRHHTEESKKLIGEHNWMKGHPERHPMLGKHHTPEALEKMSIASRNRIKPAHAIPVVVEGIKFNTKKEAYNYLGWSFGKFQRHFATL